LISEPIEMGWNKDRQSISAGDNSTNIIADRDVSIILQENVPTELVDEKIEELVTVICKTRFFTEFDQVGASLRLGKRLFDGDLAVGSAQARSRGLAWCVRFLSRSEHINDSEQYLETAKSLGGDAEVGIADAFVLSQKGEKSSALQILSDIDSAESRTASLMTVVHYDGTEAAIQWMSDAGYTINSLDSDGKSVLLSSQLQLGRWNDATQSVDSLSERDFDQAPVLLRLSAVAILSTTAPLDFRGVLLSQVPFESNGFRLASDAVSMERRREAHDRFLLAAQVASDLNCPRAASLDDEFALWLELRDPAQSQYGKNRLEDKLRDISTALGFVPLALSFSIDLDIAAVEREIDRNIAINGGMTVEAAVARFAIAFTKPSPEEAADYIFRHQEQLSSHVDPRLMRFRQVELYSQAGLTDRANEVFDCLLEQGISTEQENNLRRIISDAKGSDPVASRKEQYESTGDLGDLINLVAELEEHQCWDDFCEFGRQLFEQTRSLPDA